MPSDPTKPAVSPDDPSYHEDPPTDEDAADADSGPQASQAPVKDHRPKPADEPAPPPAKKYKMRMTQTNYLTEVGGRVFEGDVVLVDEDTAIRWYENNIAEPAPKTAKTRAEQIREKKRADFLTKAEPAEGVYDAMVNRASNEPERVGPKPMPTRRRRGQSALDFGD